MKFFASLLVCSLFILSSCNKEDGIKSKDIVEFEIRGSEYDENRSFFLAHFFRDNYENWLSAIPVVTSGVNITRVEVYVVDVSGQSESRTVLALTDLGESTRLQNHEVTINPENPDGSPASNDANNLFQSIQEYDSIQAVPSLLDVFPSFSQNLDYIQVSKARKLNETEFVVQSRLGYISLLDKLGPDEMLAVSYEYAYNGERYKVGELQSDYQDREGHELIYLKLLKPNRISTELKTWDLMMKNRYVISGEWTAENDLNLDIIYRDAADQIDHGSLPEGALLKDVPLMEVFKLDQLGPMNDREPDGQFDFIEDITINHQIVGETAFPAIITFPVLEPFGSHLEGWFDPQQESTLVDLYVFDELYSSSYSTVQLEDARNRFFITGQFHLSR